MEVKRHVPSVITSGMTVNVRRSHAGIVIRTITLTANPQLDAFWIRALRTNDECSNGRPVAVNHNCHLRFKSSQPKGALSITFWWAGSSFCCF